MEKVRKLVQNINENEGKLQESRKVLEEYSGTSNTLWQESLESYGFKRIQKQDLPRCSYFLGKNLQANPLYFGGCNQKIYVGRQEMHTDLVGSASTDHLINYSLFKLSDDNLHRALKDVTLADMTRDDFLIPAGIGALIGFVGGSFFGSLELTLGSILGGSFGIAYGVLLQDWRGKNYKPIFRVSKVSSALEGLIKELEK